MPIPDSPILRRRKHLSCSDSLRREGSARQRPMLLPVPRSLRNAIASLVLALAGVATSAGWTAMAFANPADSDAIATAAPPEGTDVWLLDLERDGDTLRAANPRNLTARPGYDNQPLFTPSGDLLFVQFEGEKTDLWRWNLARSAPVRITATPREGEYSPTPIPGSAGGISYIRSPTDTSGRLWRLPREDATPESVFPDLGPVGYHAWFDPEHVALWLLGDPSVLLLANLETGPVRKIASSVGRTPQSVPRRRAVSYTRMTEKGRAIEMFDLDVNAHEDVAVLPPGGEFHAWSPDGVLLGTAGAQVFAWQNGAWRVVVDLSVHNLKLSRLAVSPNSRHLALVAEPAE